MTDEDLEHFLSTIGKSGTRLQKQDVSGLVGQFGIGFLAAFLVARRVEVQTKRYDASQGWKWVNEGQKQYELTPFSVEAPGTTVRVFLKGPEERGLIYEEELHLSVKTYADMLPTPIYLNDRPEPINLQRMPWELPGLTDLERCHACHLYLEEKMPDNILEVIPFSLSDQVQASGVLYLTKTRTLGIDIPRSVRLYLHRMFLCDNAPDVLPKWATFVNGIINAEGLTPTAARDNFIRDGAADRLRQALGELIIEHLEKLHQQDPDRFRAIQQFHAIGIKAACFYHEDLFAKLAPLLLWRTNGSSEERLSGLRPVWKTLPDILAALPTVEGQPKALPCFTEAHSGSQYFRMANAADTLVVDASYMFEEPLLEAYTKLPDMKVRLSYLDREDTGSLFTALAPHEGLPIRRLADAMAHRLKPGGSRLRVEVRKFHPSDLTSVLRTGERSRAAHQAASWLGDPNVTDEVRDMARELLDMSRGASTQLILNASNPLIQRVARQELTTPGMELLLQGLYHSALIHNAELLTADNTNALHEFMEQLMHHVLRACEVEKDLHAREQALLQARTSARPATAVSSHRKALLVTTTDLDRGALGMALRQVVEDRWGCELLLTTVSRAGEMDSPALCEQLGQVDMVFLDCQDPSTTHGYVLGIIQGQSTGLPVMALVPSSPDALPSMLCGLNQDMIVRYPDAPEKEFINFLHHRLKEFPSVQCLYQATGRTRYLSPQFLAHVTQLSLPFSVFKSLAQAYPTLNGWETATEEQVSPLLRDYASMAAPLLHRIREHATSSDLSESRV
jgi:molecular chaperone HtpG